MESVVYCYMQDIQHYSMKYQLPASTLSTALFNSNYKAMESVILQTWQ